MKSVLLLTVFLSFIQVEKKEHDVAKSQCLKTEVKSMEDAPREKEVLFVNTGSTADTVSNKLEVITNDYLFANGNLAVMAKK